jgi:hypothetical protein
VAGPDVLFSLLMDLEEQGVQLGSCGGSLVVAPAGKLSMRLRHELRRYKKELLKEGRLQSCHPVPVAAACLQGLVEVL